MNLVCTRGLRAALIGAVSLLAACSEPNALLLTVSAERKVDSFDFTVRDVAAMQNVAETTGQALPADQDISEKGKELKLAVRFLASGTYLVHIVGRDASGIQVGARAYRVEGTVEARLQLAAVPAGGDQDGDGFPSQTACAAMAAEGFDCTYADCDDNLPRVNPLATERCNGRDDDCDGKLRDDETDEDGDGYLHCDDCDPSDETDFDSTKYIDCRDCDDQRVDVHPASRRDPGAHPAAAEDCTNCGDDIDHNCDGVINPCNDLDCDGWPGCGLEGAPLKPLCDCNDADRSINPGIPEVCGDKIDNNCDGQTDEGCMPCDVDMDGFMRNDPLNGCNPPVGQADCDDTDSGIFPGATASCNNKQGGCRTMALRGNCWRDSLGQLTIVDCNLRDTANAPKCQAADPACQARTGCPSPTCDVDGDGFMRNDPANGCNPPAGLEDCDDADPHTFPGAPDRCGDGKKQNCSYDSPCTDDADGDGYNSTEECEGADSDPNQHPWAVDLCNGKDDDCDGLTDEGNPDSTTGATVAGTKCTDNDLGECSKKEGACICSRLVPVGTRNESYRHSCRDEDVGAVASPRCFGAGQPQLETAQSCDGFDQDCDGVGDDAVGEVPCPTGTACKWATTVWKCACDPATGCDGCCVISSPADSCIYLGGESVGQCGVAGEACHTCNDANVCTTDTCDIGACHHTNFQDHQGCPGGQCRVPGSGAAAQCCGTCWLGESCAASSVTACGTGGVDCVAANTVCGTCGLCDGSGACSVMPTDDGSCGTIDCDGLDVACRNYDDITSNRCLSLGVCKSANDTSTCTSYSNAGAGTGCGTCRTCDGSGGCTSTPADDSACGTIDCDGLDVACRNYSDITSNRCLSFGSCKPANNTSTCSSYSNAGAGTGCGTCRTCDGSGACSVMPTDDGSCGTIDCDGLDTTCRDYNDITSNRCLSLGNCKPANNTSTCTSYTNAGDGTPCGTCKVCTGGTCGNVANGTACGTCRTCNNGACTGTPTDDSACGTIDCDGLDTTCRDYNDITTNRCLSFGNCKPPNDASTCTSYTNAGNGTACGTCRTCNAGACTGTPTDDSACGTIDCDGLDTTCRDYNDITTNRCLSFGNCKPPNDASTCTSYTNAGDGTKCGTCRTCSTGACTGTPTDDSACGTIDCDLLDNTCRDYNDITSNRCLSFGTCKPPNQTSTCTSYTNAGDGTKCGTGDCKACASGSCENVISGQDPNGDCGTCRWCGGGGTCVDSTNGVAGPNCSGGGKTCCNGDCCNNGEWCRDAGACGT